MAFAVEEREQTAFDVAESYKDKMKSPGIPTTFEGTADEAYERITAMVDGFSDILSESYESIPTFLSVHGSRMLSAVNELVASNRDKDDIERFREIVETFSDEAFAHLATDEALEELVWYARLSDQDPQELREALVEDIEAFRLLAVTLQLKGFDYLLAEKLHDDILVQLSYTENDLRADAAALEEDLYEKAVKPMFLKYALPRILAVQKYQVENANGVNLEPFEHLADFYGSIVFLRRALAEDAALETRDMLVQLVKDSDLEEAAADVGDLTPDAQVSAKRGKLAVFAYILSAEDEFHDSFLASKPKTDDEREELEAAVFAFIEKDYPTERDLSLGLEKGRAKMLVRLSTVLDFALIDGVVDAKKLETDVRYREAFNTMNDMFSQTEYDGFAGAMVQRAVEKYFMGFINDSASIMDPDSLSRAWNSLAYGTQTALVFHSAFDNPINLGTAVFDTPEGKNLWLKAMLARAQREAGDAAIGMPLFDGTRYEDVGFWFDVFAAVATGLVIGKLTYDRWNEFYARTPPENRGILNFVAYLLKRQSRTVAIMVVGLAYAGFPAASGKWAWSSTNLAFNMQSWTSSVLEFGVIGLKSDEKFVIYDDGSTDLTGVREIMSVWSNRASVASGALLAFALCNVVVNVYSKFNGGDASSADARRRRQSSSRNVTDGVKKAVALGFGTTLNLFKRVGSATLNTIGLNPQNAFMGGILRYKGIPVLAQPAVWLGGALVLLGGGTLYAGGSYIASGTAQNAIFDGVVEMVSYTWGCYKAIPGYAPVTVLASGTVFLSNKIGATNENWKTTAYMLAQVAAYGYMAGVLVFTDLSSLPGFKYELQKTFISEDYDYKIMTPTTGVAQFVVAAGTQYAYASIVGVLWEYVTRRKANTDGHTRAIPPPPKRVAAARFQLDMARGRIIRSSLSPDWMGQAKTRALTRMATFVAKTDMALESFGEKVTESTNNIRELQEQTA